MDKNITHFNRYLSLKFTARFKTSSIVHTFINTKKKAQQENRKKAVYKQ